MGKSWPDPDMLPVGQQSGGESALTDAEQRVVMTLWSVARAPMFVGADLVKLNGSAATKATVANPEIVNVGQAATESFQLTRSGPHGPWGPGAHVVWLARLPQNVSALALFNLGDAPATISVQLAAGASCSVRDLWARSDAGKTSGSYSRKLDSHSAAFVTLTGCPEPTAPPSAAAVAAAAPLVGAIRWDAYFSQPGEAVFELG